MNIVKPDKRKQKWLVQSTFLQKCIYDNLLRQRLLRQKQPSTKTKVGWEIHAYYLDACNCDWGCPCQFNSKPTNGHCDGVSGIHIIDGSYGKDVKLDGFNMALVGSWPGCEKCIGVMTV